MRKLSLMDLLLKPKNWWIPLLIIFVVSLGGLTVIGFHTYMDAPPVPNFVAPDGTTVYSKEDILKGQETFHKYALMEYGSMFGDGALRGPDFTAEALHEMSLSMVEFYNNKFRPEAGTSGALLRQGIVDQVKKEIKLNTYSQAGNTVALNEAQVYAAQKLAEYYTAVFTDSESPQAFRPVYYITDKDELRTLAGFFFWGGWVCGSERPGKNYSYTHNWPFDPDAGNTSTSATLLWSIVGALGLLLGLGAVLYYHGKLEKLNDEAFTRSSDPLMTNEGVKKFEPTRTQKATYKFFAAAMVLFLLQVVAGILTVHDFVGFVDFWGYDISADFPVTVVRSWHLQLSLLWISACWIGASFFVMPLLSPKEPKKQLQMINFMFWLIIALVAGSVAGIFLGPKGLLPESWYWLGHQGWEYLEPGKVWQMLLYGIFVLWAAILYRGLRPVMKIKQPWALPNWLVYTTVSIILLLTSGFIATPETNFVIADFWRWCVIHMWVEAFFEVFTTILIGYFMVLMGLVNVQSALRVIYLATLLFLGSGLLGISHNFYWNAKPEGTMALGAVFSTLQVVPLILLTLEAWRFSKLPGMKQKKNGLLGAGQTLFGFREVFLFLLAVNFWNFLGAGVMGFTINLPIANYFEHGTYLTVNHGHAALMGVYGNLSVAAVLFCCQLLSHAHRWRAPLLRVVFWSINLGLMLMVVLDLFPVGVWQFRTVVEEGLWFARSDVFIDSTGFQTFTWLRIVGGSLFVLGGVIPLTWFVLSLRKHLKKDKTALNGQARKEKDWFAADKKLQRV